MVQDQVPDTPESTEFELANPKLLNQPSWILSFLSLKATKKDLLPFSDDLLRCFPKWPSSWWIIKNSKAVIPFVDLSLPE